MGEDFIKNSRGTTRAGSYEFGCVALANADLTVITYDDELLLTVQHRDGEFETVIGRYVPPGDAPVHPQSDLNREDFYKFNVQNDTGEAITHITSPCERPQTRTKAR